MTLPRCGWLAVAIALGFGCVTTPSGPRRELTPELCLEPGFRCSSGGECCSGSCVGPNEEQAQCL